MSDYDGFEKVTVSGVYMANEPEDSTPIVFLENEEERILPIFIGAAEAFSIQTALDELPYPRPLTHDLIISIRPSSPAS
jgi:bifunctional DNase/RNase